MALWLSPELLGNEIRKVRASLGLSQTAFGEALGLKPPGAQTIVSGWERGRGVSGESLAKIAALAAVPISTFQAESRKPTAQLTTRDVVALRDRMRTIRSDAEEVLVVLDEALGSGDVEVLMHDPPIDGEDADKDGNRRRA